MGWATGHIAKLYQGKTVQFRPRGNSMTPKIKSGQLCTVRPVREEDVKTGDVVLCRVRGSEYLHLVKAIKGSPGSLRFQIGNNHGKVNGWVDARNIFGKLIEVG